MSEAQISILLGYLSAQISMYGPSLLLALLIFHATVFFTIRLRRAK